jgi:DNA-binding MarR family transcriptional regulator
MLGSKQPVVNRDFSPTKQQRRVLDVLREEYQVNPRRIRDVTGIERQRVNDALGALENAGWIEKRSRGLYRLVYNGDCLVEQIIRCRDEH